MIVSISKVTYDVLRDVCWCKITLANGSRIFDVGEKFYEIFLIDVNMKTFPTTKTSLQRILWNVNFTMPYIIGFTYPME